MDRYTSILISEPDFARLHALVDQNSEGRNATAAELLDSELSRAQVVPVERIPEDVVTMNSRVVFEDDARGIRREVVLVYPANADASAGRVSVLAPVGAALLGLAVNDTIEWPIPSGRPARFRIVSVSQPHGADVVPSQSSTRASIGTRASTGTSD